MKNQEKVLSRRQMLEMALGFGGLAILGGSGLAQTAERMVTPEVTIFFAILF